MNKLIVVIIFLQIGCNYPNNQNGALVNKIHKVKKGMKFNEAISIMGLPDTIEHYNDEDGQYFGAFYGTPYQFASSTVYISFTKDSIVRYCTDGS